jgi:hypothetical protein
LKANIYIPFIIWGERYINNFINYCLNNLLLEINDNHQFYNKFKINLIFFTQDHEIKKLKTILGNEFNVKYYNIDYLVNEFENKRLDKYQLLKVIQQAVIFKYKKDSIFLFLYPDFIWKLGSLRNVLLKALEKKVVLVYCPQSIEENIETEQLNKEFFSEKFEGYLIKNLHPIITSNEFDKNKNDFNTAACIPLKIKDGFIFRNFHLHPISINTSLFQNYEYLRNINVSFDEDYIQNLDLKSNEYYIPKKSNEMIFSSLLGKYELSLPLNINKNIFENYYHWVEVNALQIHIKFSKNKFYLTKSNKEIDNNNFEYDNMFENIYSKIDQKNYQLLANKNYIYFIARQVKFNKYFTESDYFLEKVHKEYLKKFLKIKTTGNSSLLLTFNKRQQYISKNFIKTFYEE